MSNIKLLLYHGGSFGYSGTSYNGGYVITMENLDTDTLSIEELADMYRSLGYFSTFKLFYKLPQMSFTDGVKPLTTDKEFLEMIAVVEKKGLVVEIFGDHLVEIENEQETTENKDEKEKEKANITGDLNEETEDDSDSSVGSELLETDSENDEDLFDANTELEANEDMKDWFDDNEHFISMSSKQGIDITEQWEAVCEEENSSSDELKSLCDSDEEEAQKQKFPLFNEQTDFDSPIALLVGMRFTSPAIFRKALKAFHIQNGSDYKFVKNDGKKIAARCKADCGWYIYASWSTCKKYFQIKTLNNKHRCGRVYHHSKVDYNWICNQYLNIIKVSPDLKVEALQALVLKDYGIAVNIRQCYRARKKAMALIEGDEKMQYLLLRNYCEALLHWNPGSTAKIETDNNVFKRCYICLAACKMGFLQSCRPFIGVDACHLKGRTSGQLMVAVGKDGNENMYPIAYAVVEGETKEAWIWFLTLLISDIGPVEEYGWTFISDRQKGLLPAFEMVLPGAYHRHCVRHMYKNFNGVHPGKTLKDKMWAAARARTKEEFMQCMDSLGNSSKGARDWLINANPDVWSRHTFSSRPKSDLLLNNISESFNSSILDARKKPILVMLETLRRKWMQRFQLKRDGMRAYPGLICPAILKKLEKAKVAARKCLVHWGGGSTFEVDYTEGSRFVGDSENYGCKRVVVDLEARSCGRKKWDLTGIPCHHACAAILYHKHNLESYVDDYYSKEAYLRSYAPLISSMPGPEFWSKAIGEPVLPPPYRKQPGRPKKHSRKKEPEEIANQNKITKRGSMVRCGNCRELGHNSKKCSRPINPDYATRKENAKLKRASKISTSKSKLKKKKGDVLSTNIFNHQNEGHN